jgi:hypothetical protein
MCDFDPCRKSSTNSSDEEYQYALDRAKDVYYFLKEQGFEVWKETNPDSKKIMKKDKYVFIK